MPVTLFSKSSRRAWLRRGLLGSAAGLWSAAEAADRARDGDGEFWALFSDTHIAAEEEKEAREVVMAENLRRCVKQVLAAGQKPHGVLINGDCAFLDGQEGDYAVFARLLGPLAQERVQVHCTLGNHDSRGAFRAAMSQPGVEPLLEDKHVTILSSARLNWVLLDSLDAVNVTPGRLGGGQLGWLARALRKLGSRPVVVMLHHDLLSAGADTAKPAGLLDTKEFWSTLAGFPNVKAVIHGHTHRWEAREPADGLPWVISLPPVAYVFGPEHPNGWMRAMVGDGVMRLTLQCLNPAHPEHKRQIEIPLA
jgi:Icc protein